MVEKVSFTVFLKDHLSGGLKKLAASGNTSLARLRVGFRKLSSAAKSSLAKIKTGMLGLNRTGMALNTTMRTLIAGFGIFYMLNLGGNILKWGADMEQTRISFQTLLQSVEKGNTLFEKINEFANRTPFDNRGLQANAKTLLSFGIAGDKVMGTLKMLGDVAGGNKDRMRALTLAFAQSQAAGKLMGQDLLQFVNAGFNPLKVISEKTGKSLMELRSEMQKGTISSEMIAWAFQTATSKGGMFYQMMDKQSQTIAGKWSTLVGTIQFKLGKLVESNNTFFTSIIDGLIWSFNTFVNVMKNVFGFVSEYKEIILGIAGGLALYNGAILGVILVTKIWAAVQWLLNAAMTANPIGIIIVAIGALVGGIIWAWNKFEGFRKVILGTWEVIRGLADMIKNYVINRITELIRGIMGVGSAISLLFQGKFKAAANAGAKALGNIFVGQESKREAYAAGLALGEAYNKGADGAVRAAKEPGATTGAETGGTGSSPSPFPGFGGASGGGDTNLGSVSGSIQGMSGSGGTKNITITIGSLIERFEVHTTNMQEGIDDMADKVKEVLMTAVNDANLAAG